MTARPNYIYTDNVCFRSTPDLNARLIRFSTVLGHDKSHVIRFLLTQCLRAYEADAEAIARIREELY